ncbi:hypothetical protein [Parapedobacter koreensis]|uniref:Uncharacterized protein n=1 Tax=Parapedobacter koreensis TaxID=332977 RepID=A0A1H7P1N9_9SPHI|nr:hypothetical protein [Parapedobacter koreensis]SEL29519.1 hypothetical protein SAMN05421740_104175 [Parapedobacter koreensis]
MKTSLDDLQLMENCLLGRASGEQRTLFEARLLLDPVLREDAHWQQQTYRIIRDYGRKQLRNELEQVHQVLFTAPRHRAFRDKVLSFFGK